MSPIFRLWAPVIVYIIFSRDLILMLLILWFSSNFQFTKFHKTFPLLKVLFPIKILREQHEKAGYFTFYACMWKHKQQIFFCGLWHPLTVLSLPFNVGYEHFSMCTKRIEWKIIALKVAWTARIFFLLPSSLKLFLMQTSECIWDLIF